jgi:SpoIID/LytB domain protein
MRLARFITLVAVVAALLVPGVARAERTVRIPGGGWGHGIGMSQYGAYGRALNGAGAQTILEKYYSNANVVSVNLPKRIRVGLLPDYGAGGRGAISFSGKQRGDGAGIVKVRVKGSQATIVEAAPGDTIRAQTGGAGGFRIFKNGNRVRRAGKSVFGGPNKPLRVTFRKSGALLDPADKPHDYAFGTAEISSYATDSCSTGFCARLVLKLPMQKYLYGLGEVPSSWPGAVLRAQAIAGRTYAFSKIDRSGQHRYPCGCAVYDSVIDQAYIGDSKRTGSGAYWGDWKSAVDDTNRQVVLYKGEPIQALYSSSSGGHTEHNENVWGGDPIPYLRGVRDGRDRAEGNNPNYKWQVEMTWNQFSSKLNAAYGTGELQDFKIVKPLGVSGRVTVVKDASSGGARIVGAKKTVRVSGWSLRSALGLKDTLFAVDLGSGVGTQFQARYDALNGAPGDPTGDTYPVPIGSANPKGSAQDFTQGRMVKDSSTNGITWQYGRVLNRYDARGREASNLKMPRSDVKGSGNYLFARYANGRIVWSEGNGAHAIVGRFDGAYIRVGKIGGPLGPPIKFRQTMQTLPDGGRRQRFEGGTLYQVGKGGPVYAIWGPVADRYRNIGEATSACGYPTGDATEEDLIVTAAFENGTITYDPTTGLKTDC